MPDCFFRFSPNLPSWTHKYVTQSSWVVCCTVAKSCLTFCNPHGLQHARPLCSSLSPGLSSDSCPLIQWCYLTITFSDAPFSFCLQSFPTSEAFPASQLSSSGGQTIGALASASDAFPVNIQGWFPLYWLVWSPCSPGASQEPSPAPQFKSINSLALSLLYDPILTFVHDYWKN